MRDFCLAFGVGVKPKTTDFQILSRQLRLSEPTRASAVAASLMSEFPAAGAKWVTPHSSSLL